MRGGHIELSSPESSENSSNDSFQLQTRFKTGNHSRTYSVHLRWSCMRFVKYLSRDGLPIELFLAQPF